QRERTVAVITGSDMNTAMFFVPVNGSIGDSSLAESPGVIVKQSVSQEPRHKAEGVPIAVALKPVIPGIGRLGGSPKNWTSGVMLRRPQLRNIDSDSATTRDLHRSLPVPV